MKAGQPVDPIHGWRAKQRSVHNTYFTLPVLVCDAVQPLRLAPTQASDNWLVLVLLMLAGALIRPQLRRAAPAPVVARRERPGSTRSSARWRSPGLVVWLAPAPAGGERACRTGGRGLSTAVRAVIDRRCAMCHSRRRPAEARLAADARAVAQHAARSTSRRWSSS